MKMMNLHQGDKVNDKDMLKLINEKVIKRFKGLRPQKTIKRVLFGAFAPQKA